MNKFLFFLLLASLSSCAVFKDDYKVRSLVNDLKRLKILEITYYDVTYRKGVEVKRILVLEKSGNAEMTKKAKKIRKLFKNNSLVDEVKLVSPEEREAENYLVVLNKIVIQPESKRFGYAAWGIGSLITAGVLPWWKDESIKMSLRAYKGRIKKEFDITRGYTKGFSLFLLPVMPFRAPFWQMKEIESEVAAEVINTGFYSP